MERIKEEINRILLFAPVPGQEDLQCVLGNIVPSDLGQHNSINSYKLKILKCRMLIFSEPRIIASPVHGMGCQVYVIMSKDFYRSGKVQHHLEKFGICGGRNVQATNSVYEACLRYTILARIAPLWNQVGSYLVKGRDFLLLREPLHAITFDVIMTGKELSMIIWPYRLMMFRVTLEDLIEANKENFEGNSEVEINQGKWVYVLPSLNKAQVVSVSKELPKSSTFSTYKQLKRHWKNNYGYRIPEEVACPFYVTVTFGKVRPKLGPEGWSGDVYVYPGMCVCQCPPVILRCRDQTVPLQSFLKELSARVPQICDHPFAGDQVELGYTMPKLHSCSNENNPSPKQKFNSKEFMEIFKSLNGICHVPIENPTFLVHSTYPSAELFSTKIAATSIFEGKHISSNQGKSMEGNSANNGVNERKVAIATEKLEVKDKIRYVPVFKSKMKPINPTCKLSNVNPSKIKTSTTQKMLGNSNNNINISRKEIMKEVVDRQGNNTTNNKLDKIMKVKVLKQKMDGSGFKSHIIGEIKGKSQFIPKGSQNILPKIIGADSTSKNKCATEKMPTNNKHESTLILKEHKPSKNSGFGSTTVLKSDNSDGKAQNEEKYSTATKDKAHYFTMEFGLWDGEGSEISTSQQNASLMDWKNIFNDSSSLSAEKSKLYQGTSTDGVIPLDKNELSVHKAEEEKYVRSLPKKNPISRGRPAIQVGMDVEALAKEGILNRANTTTLISWLRSRGVTCRVKDRKSELVHSVEAVLGLPQLNHATRP